MIFGSGSAKFDYSGSVITLEYSNLRPNWSNKIVKTITSIYDHYTTYYSPGYYSDFYVDIDLTKYGTNDYVKFNEVYPYIYTKVYFWPHEDGNAISGSDGKGVVFFIDGMEHKYYSNDFVQNDILTIHFTSTDYTTLTGSLVWVYLEQVIQ